MVKYRKAAVSDSKSMARIHMLAFEGFFLTKLGFDFLCTYYHSCLKNKNTIAICAYSPDDNLIGFASGSIRSKGYHSEVVSENLAKFCVALLKVIVTRPHAILRLLFNLDKNKKHDDKGNYSELLSIAILPGYKGTGIGRIMLSEFEREVERRDGSCITLTTDYFNNENVIGFYKKSGYHFLYSFVTYPKRKMIKMIKMLKK